MKKVRDSLRKLPPVITVAALSSLPLLGFGRQDHSQDETHTHTHTHTRTHITHRIKVIKMNTIILEHTGRIFYILVE